MKKVLVLLALLCVLVGCQKEGDTVSKDKESDNEAVETTETITEESNEATIIIEGADDENNSSDETTPDEQEENQEQ